MLIYSLKFYSRVKREGRERKNSSRQALNSKERQEARLVKRNLLRLAILGKD